MKTSEKTVVASHNKLGPFELKPLAKNALLNVSLLSFAFILLITATSRVNAGGFDIPTGAGPSPLFGALPFTQKLMLFEEFGVRSLPTNDCVDCGSLPLPSTCTSVPDGGALDSFLTTPLHPMPMRTSNSSALNPWHSKISDCVRPLQTSKIEGRPPGEWFAHQRYDEFYPQVYFQTAQTGARMNNGARDALQLHQYSVGEFGPNGLYNNGSTNWGIQPRIHPNMPIQDPTALWTFDGTFPPKLLMARYGVPILFRHYNALPIDPSANSGFGAHTISTHEHNGHNPAESDGFAHAYFMPGQFFDYRWPMILAGRDRTNVAAVDPRAGTPDGHGGIINIPGDWRETMSTHWFHDHMVDHTAQNVYKGNAAMMNYYSSIDRGNEALNCNYANPGNPNLCLPSGTALDWGNRDYDVNLVVADKAWDKNGQLFFNIFNTDGFLGDHVTVNWQYKPYLEVRARRYRFRILNGSVSRYYKIAVVDQAGKPVPFHLVANDGNIMEHAVAFPNSQSQELPSQGIAERYDIVIDFKNYKDGDKLYLVNLLEHKNGMTPNRAIPLSEVLSGKYRNTLNGGQYQGDPAVGKFMELRVKSYAGQDLSMNPADYVEGKKKMIPLPGFTTAELQNARHRTFEFVKSAPTDTQPWAIKTDGGEAYSADLSRVSAAPDEGSVEIWHLKTNSSSWSHPVHVHFEEGQILKRGGVAPPVWEKWARKDVYRVGGPLQDTTGSVDLAIRFREFMGTYMEHCHNTQHEDHAMLLRWDIQKPGQTIAIPTPITNWEGTTYEDSYSLPTVKTGDTSAKLQSTR
jgi:manganese oxidase